MLEKKIPFIAIQLTTKCNLDCQFCFRRLNFNEVSNEKMQLVLRKIIELNPGKIVLSGGEPLLRPDIVDILKTIKEHNIKTVLQSNALLLPQFIDKVDKYVDWYSLSLDAENNNINSIMRGPKQFDMVLESINKINELNKPIKLGTVVSAVNKDFITGIGKQIKEKVTIWKLYQFYPRKDCFAQKNQEKFKINNDDFWNVINATKQLYPSMVISPHSVEDFSDGPCVLIHPDGDVFLTRGTKDVLIGNLFTVESTTIKSKILNNDSFASIIKNYEKTYNDEVLK